MRGVAASAPVQYRVANDTLLLRERGREPLVTIARPRLFSASKAQLRVFLYFLLFAVDVGLLALAFLCAGFLRLGDPLAEQTLKTLAVIMPTFVAISMHNGAYSIQALQRPGFAAAKVIEALAYSLAVAIGLLFYMKASVQFSRQVFAMGTAASMLFIPVGRWVTGLHIQRKCRGRLLNRLLVIDDCDPDLVRSTGEVVISAAELGLSFDDDHPLVLDRLGEALAGCDSVVVACSEQRRAKWAHALKSAAVNVEIMSPELDRIQALAIGDFNGHKTLLVSVRPLNLRQRALKRALDLAIAIPSLVLLAPVMALIAIAVLVEGQGPVFFRQQRVGQNNRLFNVLKFRTFAHGCADPRGDRSVERCDARVTRLGALLRRTSLDEVPQLINVLAGHMSIVGPRPHALGSTAGNSLFWEIDSRYLHRHAVKPGMTGLAQVRGYRGATLRQDDLTNRLHSDLEYVSNWTIWRDLKIVVATFGVLLHPNAY